MKKYLPFKQATQDPACRQAGFTLIELLVVVSIIAILAVVSLSLFGNAQKVARDGVRRAEVNAIAKSLETARDLPSGNYRYDATYFSNDFGNSTPHDPSNATPQYCVGYSTDATATYTSGPNLYPTTTTWTGACPSTAINGTPAGAWGSFTSSTPAYALPAGFTNSKRWKICAKLEATTSAFCIDNVWKP